MERRLAAVMIADVVGYSRHSQADEEGTRARFQTDLHEVFEPQIAGHHGRLVKTMGDALLVEFHSVVDAVRCAVEMQRIKEERNASVPERERLVYRIGINLGDVIIEGDDIHGVGVNIADRLQGLANPGGVAISGPVYDQVGTKLDAGYHFLGEKPVKNVDVPVRVYRVLSNPEAAGKTIVAAGRPIRSWYRPAVAMAVILVVAVGATAWWRPWEPQPETAVAAIPALPDKPSIAVLPFDNMSTDAEQGYLADGLTEDLTTELARLPGLFVVSRNAAFTYKGKDVEPAQVAAKLGVRYILEGSVRRVGDDMRINAQLVDARTSGHLWAERYDGAWSDVFKLQDRMIEQIATALKLRLVDGPRTGQIAGGTSNPAAYDAFLRGLELEYRDTPEDIAKAVAFYQQAIALDPEFGRAIAELAWVYWNAGGIGPVEDALGLSGNEATEKLNHYLEAAAKHPSPTYYQLLSDQLVRRHQSDEAIGAIEKAIALDSSDAWNYEGMSQALTFNGRAADGRGFVDAAMRVDPGWTPWRHYLAGLAYFSMGRFEDAVASLEKIDPESGGYWANFYGLILRMSAAGHLGRVDDAAAVKGRLAPILSQRDAELSGLMVQTFFVYKNHADTERLLDGLRKAGVSDLPFGYDPMSKDRLRGEEITSLLYGHAVRTRSLRSGRECTIARTMDGTPTQACGSWSDTGSVPRLNDDILCYSWQGSGAVCVAYFRNPAGTPEQHNEFISVTQSNQSEFSIID